MNPSTDSSSTKSKALLDELHTLVAEAERLAGAPSGDHASDILEGLRSRYDEANARLSELYTCTKKRVIAGAHQADEAVRAHPYQSLAIALGAGLMAGFLLGRRER
jgi:ElaB/YqjD/DUF883 family membrane-anchored ribosome-binding protein